MLVESTEIVAVVKNALPLKWSTRFSLWTDEPNAPPRETDTFAHALQDIEPFSIGSVIYENAERKHAAGRHLFG